MFTKSVDCPCLSFNLRLNVLKNYIVLCDDLTSDAQIYNISDLPNSFIFRRTCKTELEAGRTIGLT